MKTMKEKSYASAFIKNGSRFRRDYQSKRHSVKLNNIVASKHTYEKSMSMQSRELIDKGAKIKMIAVYANKINDAQNEKASLTYTLIINGSITQKIVPINVAAANDEIKFIRRKDGTEQIDNTLLIDDYISSAVLVIEGRYDETVAIANIKVIKEGVDA